MSAGRSWLGQGAVPHDSSNAPQDEASKSAAATTFFHETKLELFV